MKTRKRTMVHRLLYTSLLVMIMTVVVYLPNMAATKDVSIEEGTYYIKATNGNAKGQVLYWTKGNDNKTLEFESSGGSHADYEIWYITKHRCWENGSLPYLTGYYSIYAYNDYKGNKFDDNRICINNIADNAILPTRDDYPDVYCGDISNLIDAFKFVNEKGQDAYDNLTIRPNEKEMYETGYKLNRHKEVKAFKHELIYLDGRKDNDTNNKLWELVPVNFERSMTKAAPTLTAQKSGNVTINWDKLRNKIKGKKVWKNAKYIEIQYSTDKNFEKNVKTKKIKKKSVNKAKAKTAVKNLRKKQKKTYYLRVRLIDKKGVGSNWSKSVKIKPKK